MNEENELVQYGKNVLISFAEQNPFIGGLIKILDDKNSELIMERSRKLESRIENLEFFQKQLSYLMDDKSKYIHIRNFLSFYFTKTDPALIDTNINIFLDYIQEKNNNSSYNLLLEKICLLSKESLNVMKKIKVMTKNGSYYEWKDLLKLYSNVNQDLSYRDILTSKDLNDELLELSFGLKNLIENDFIISLSTNYPGSIDIYNVDQFSITNIGYLLLEYLNLNTF